MMRMLTLGTGMGIGYVLGSRAGRDRYEQIKSVAAHVKDSAPVERIVDRAAARAEEDWNRADSAPAADSADPPSGDHSATADHSAHLTAGAPQSGALQSGDGIDEARSQALYAASMEGIGVGSVHSLR